MTNEQINQLIEDTTNEVQQEETETINELANEIVTTGTEVYLTYDQFLVVSGYFTEILWTLRVLAVVIIIAFVWGLVKR